MLNKLQRMLNHYHMLQPGDQLICAVSGGADSVALLFAMYLLREKLNIQLSAAHFNHQLRGDESKRDEMFVRQLCDRLEVPLYVGSGRVVAGKKGLEAAARDARYDFLKALPGKIATAHTANDNLETVLMHLVRGTGLKGLGGIAPVNGSVIRPMLEVTRDEVLRFLNEYHLSYVTDSTNSENTFFRNRLRQSVIPLLEKENPSLATGISAMAQQLREDEAVLQELAASADPTDIGSLRNMRPALRSRTIRAFLMDCGIREPESKHVDGVEKLIYSNNPSARVTLRDGIVISRCYDRLTCIDPEKSLKPIDLRCPGVTALREIGVDVVCTPADRMVDTSDCFVVIPTGMLRVRHRLSGDIMRLSGGSKNLKKLFIDKKIPATERMLVPVIADDAGVIAVYGFGANRDRLCMGENAVQIRFVRSEKKEEEQK